MDVSFGWRWTGKREVAKENWFMVNSTHVVDMAFLLGGFPKELESYTAGDCDWHPDSAVFAGSGVSEYGALFSYQANWLAPGRWSVEILTLNNRLVFRPLEKLQVQKPKSVAIEFVDIDDQLDVEFKPGFLFIPEKEAMKWVEFTGLVITPLDTNLVAAIIGMYFGGSLVKR